jgi:hypothetical protein
MQTGLDVGIDVASKAVVVACAVSSFAPCTVRNERGALRKWLAGLPSGSRIGMEATGSLPPVGGGPGTRRARCTCSTPAT